MNTLQDLKPFVLPLLLLTFGIRCQFAQTYGLILAHLASAFLHDINYLFDHPVEVVEYGWFLLTDDVQQRRTVEHAAEPCPALADVAVVLDALAHLGLQLLHGVD